MLYLNNDQKFKSKLKKSRDILAQDTSSAVNLAEDYCMGVSISMHPDDYYNGCYYEMGYWAGYPHLENDNGAHLYFYDSNGMGYWQLDDREQDGMNDWANGGYFYCGDRENWD